jgi:hypothetical protein
MFKDIPPRNGYVIDNLEGQLFEAITTPIDDTEAVGTVGYHIEEKSN